MTDGRITMRDAAKWRRTDEQITELARQYVTREVLVTNDVDTINSAFYMLLAFLSFTEAAAKQVGALIGFLSQVVPGRAMNGYPIFVQMGFLHVDDLPRFKAEVARMNAALGIVEQAEHG